MLHATGRSLCALLALSVASWAAAAETPSGPLLIIGGALQANNDAVFKRLIATAKVDGRTRFGLFPTAGNDGEGAANFKEQLKARGVSENDVEIIKLTEANAPQQAESPAMAEQIRNCTAIFFAGGDQLRITKALLRPDGTRTAALQAIDEVRRRGGAVSGTSAGAAAQSETMIAVAGLPDSSLDDGMDVLDFGLTNSLKSPAKRGLLVTRGLGFFRGGIIDQHFSQRRGRLARLVRAAIENKVRFGYGVDEDTALEVAPDGRVEVLGTGCVIVINALHAKCEDGPLGCRMTGILISCLEHGDRFDPATGVASPHAVKRPVPAGMEGYNGNFMIPDIAAREAVQQALFSGLLNNTSRTQVGVTFKHHLHYAHGYRFTFNENDQTQFLEGEVEGRSASSVLDVRLDIEPATMTLKPPQTAVPQDIVDSPSRKPLEAIWFRGIMLDDERGRFRPQSPITRGEFAGALAQTIRLQPPRGKSPAMADVSPATPLAHEIALTVAAGFMDLDERGAFRPTEPISRQAAALALVRLTERYRSEKLRENPVELKDAASILQPYRNAIFAAAGAKLLTVAPAFRPAENLTREEAAVAIYAIVGFPW